VAKTPPKIMRPFASWFVTIYFIAVAVYSLVFALLYDPYCLPLYVQAGLTVASAVGVFMLKRWSLWLSAISMPIILAVELSAFSYSTTIGGFNPNLSILLMHLSYLIIVIFAAFSTLFLIDKRREFK
jgi:uncharacterized membrane protein (DUF2068 family)